LINHIWKRVAGKQDYFKTPLPSVRLRTNLNHVALRLGLHSIPFQIAYEIQNG
jgi:hypothetical protein